MGRVAWPFSCSRNAHDKNVLVRRAQSRIGQAALENEMREWEDARSGRSISPHPWRDNQRAWREHIYRSMRAVKGSLGHSPKGRSRLGRTPTLVLCSRNRGGDGPDDLLCSRNAHGLVCLVYLVSLVLLDEFPVPSTRQTRSTR